MDFSIRLRDIVIKSFDYQERVFSFKIGGLKITEVSMVGRDDNQKISLPFHINKGKLNITFDFKQEDLELQPYNIFVSVLGVKLRVKLQGMAAKRMDERYIEITRDSGFKEFLYFSISGRLTYLKVKYSPNLFPVETQVITINDIEISNRQLSFAVSDSDKAFDRLYLYNVTHRYIEITDFIYEAGCITVTFTDGFFTHGPDEWRIRLGVLKNGQSCIYDTRLDDEHFPIVFNNGYELIHRIGQVIGKLYDHHTLQAIETRDDKICFQISVITKNSPLTHLEGICLNRSTNEFISAPATIHKIIAKGIDNDYTDILLRENGETIYDLKHKTKRITHFENIITFEFSNLDFPLNNSEGIINYERYDTNVYDIYMAFHIKDNLFYPSNRVRVHYNSDLKDEYHLNQNDKYSLILKAFPAARQHLLAFRPIFLPKKSLVLYENIQERFPNGKPLIDEKPILLVSEYPEKAQDNGLAFFEYVLKHHSDDMVAYYIISEDSPDLEHLKLPEEKIVYYKSPKHFDLMTRATYIAHTHSSFYAVPLLSDYANLYALRMKKIFLQHGIMGVRDLSYLYGKRTLFTDRYVVSSDREKKLVLNMGYEENEIVLSGLSRFDSLLTGNCVEKTLSLRKKILIMPTWRINQERLLDEQFKKTIFYQEFQRLITSETLKNLAQSENLTINFYLHHNFQRYHHLFESEFVNILREDDVTVQELLREHGILITDYSSVGLDFSLQNRKVLYYQFDRLDELQNAKELDGLLPGPIMTNYQSLFENISEAVMDNRLSEEYVQKRRANLYAFDDLNASERIYQAMIEIE